MIRILRHISPGSLAIKTTVTLTLKAVQEPWSLLEFLSYLNVLYYKICYKDFISDGDNKTFAVLSEAQPYGTVHPIQKLDCVGHVQKQLGIASSQKFKGRLKT